MSSAPSLQVPGLLRPPSPPRPSPAAATTIPTRLSTVWPAYRPAPDELLLNLGPTHALNTLRNPTGPLRVCLDAAPAAERILALRAAAAAASIFSWLAELRAWPWLSSGFAAAFAVPPSDQTLCQHDGDHPSPDPVPATALPTIALYARLRTRIDDISAAVDHLAIDEMHRHVLHRHILPLSRPTTRSADSATLSSTSSSPLTASSYNKMEDITAVITSIVVRALPNLTHLSRLLRVWSARLAVLRRVPSFLHALSSAEMAVGAAWVQLLRPPPISFIPSILVADTTVAYSTPGLLSHHDILLDSAHATLDATVSQPGCILDAMLDALEGYDDTLPPDWLDRTERVEHDYAGWVAGAQLARRKREWMLGPQRESSASSHDTPPHYCPDPVVLAQDCADTASIVDEDEDAHVGFLAQWPMPTDKAEAALPPLLHGGDQQSSDGSDASTITRCPSGSFDLSSDQPDLDLSSSPSPSPTKPVARRLFGRDRPIAHTGTIPSSPPSLRLVTTSSGSHSDSVLKPERSLEPTSPSHSRLAVSFTSRSAEQTGYDQEGGDDRLRQQISDILGSIPGKFRLMADDHPTPDLHPNLSLNPPDLNLPSLRRPPARDATRRSASSLSAHSSSSRAPTPSYTLSPAKRATSRRFHLRGSSHQHETQVYHLSRSTGGPPIKLFIRLVGENGERVMVRVGGGWADLGEYLKEYASHHGRRSGTAVVDISDTHPSRGSLDRPVSPGFSLQATAVTASPPSSPVSAGPLTPLIVRKKRNSLSRQADDPRRPALVLSALPRTPATDPLPPPPSAAAATTTAAPRSRACSTTGTLIATPSSSSASLGYSRPSSRLSHTAAAVAADDDEPVLGLAGPIGRRVEMSDESWAWVESVKEKVRLASASSTPASHSSSLFGDMGKVGSTQRLFRRG